MARRLLLVALAAAALSGCGGEPEPAAPGLPQPPSGVPEGGSNLGSDVRAREAAPREQGLLGALSALLERGAPERTDAPRETSGPARSARELAGRLPRSRAAAQVLLAGFDGTTADALGSLDLGAVLLERRNFVDLAQLRALTDGLAAAAKERRHLPPLVVAVQDGSEDAAFPSLPGGEPERSHDPGAVRRRAAAAGAQLRVLGVGMTLAPIADLSQDASFGDDPETVAQLTAATVDGFAAGGIVAAPRHFPGQGAASQDPLRGPAYVGLRRDALLARDVAPFRGPLHAVVLSNAAYLAFDPSTPAALTPQAHALLRDELGFDGVALADNVLGTAAATGMTPGDAAVAALAAGCDMVLVRDAEERREAHGAILAALRRGELPDARLREAVARVLALKAATRTLAPGS